MSSNGGNGLPFMLGIFKRSERLVLQKNDEGIL